MKTILLMLAIAGVCFAQDAKVENFPDDMDVIRVALTDSAKLRELSTTVDRAKEALDQYQKQVSQKLEDAWDEHEEQRRKEARQKPSSLVPWVIVGSGSRGMSYGSIISNTFVFAKDFSFARHQRMADAGGYGLSWGGSYDSCRPPDSSPEVHSLPVEESRLGTQLSTAKKSADEAWDQWQAHIAKKYSIDGELKYSTDFGLVVRANTPQYGSCVHPL